MTLDYYQSLALTTAQYPNIGKNIYYPTLGLAGEAGEVANKVKKIMRDMGGNVSPESQVQIALELGDVLWYVAMLATELQFPLNKIAKMNIGKLAARKEAGKIGGSGDNR